VSAWPGTLAGSEPEGRPHPRWGGQAPLEAVVSVELSGLPSALLRLPRPAWRRSTACVAGEAWTSPVGLPVEVTELGRAISPHSVEPGLVLSTPKTILITGAGEQ
jgi:hypothetical protein